MGEPYAKDVYDTISNWWYQLDSCVSIDKYTNTVIGWKKQGNLNICLGTKDPSASPITLGSSLNDIVKAMGTPSGVSFDGGTHKPYRLDYNSSEVFIQNDKVEGWSNRGGLKVSMGSADPSFQGFNISSTMVDVVKSMGTPDNIQQTYVWFYGNSCILFDNNWIMYNIDNKGNLKIK